MTLNIPNGRPLLHQLGPDMRPLTPGGRYLSSRRGLDVDTPGRSPSPAP